MKVFIGLVALIYILSMASGIEVTVHTYKSGNNTLVWVDSLAPKECNSQCKFELEEIDCEDMILKNVSLIKTTMTSLKTDVADFTTAVENKLKVIAANVSQCVSVQKATDVNEKLRVDIKQDLNGIVDSKIEGMRTLFTQQNKTHALQLQLETEKGSAQTCAVSLSAAQKDVEQLQGDVDSLNWVLVFAVIIIIGLVITLANGWRPLRRQVGI